MDHGSNGFAVNSLDIIEGVMESGVQDDEPRGKTALARQTAKQPSKLDSAVERGDQATLDRLDTCHSLFEVGSLPVQLNPQATRIIRVVVFTPEGGVGEVVDAIHGVSGGEVEINVIAVESALALGNDGCNKLGAIIAAFDQRSMDCGGRDQREDH